MSQARRVTCQCAQDHTEELRPPRRRRNQRVKNCTGQNAESGKPVLAQTHRPFSASVPGEPRPSLSPAPKPCRQANIGSPEVLPLSKLHLFSHPLLCQPQVQVLVLAHKPLGFGSPNPTPNPWAGTPSSLYLSFPIRMVKFLVLLKSHLPGSAGFQRLNCEGRS